MTLVPGNRYAEFTAAARRVAPSVLLPALAKASTRQFERGVNDPRPNEIIHPWVIAAAARENIAYGNEHRQRTVTAKDLARLCNLYLELDEAFLNAADEPGSVESLMVRAVFEQRSFEHTVEDLSRILLLFDRDYSPLHCEVLSASAWERLLGTPLERFMRAAFFILVGALRSGGQFSPGWLSLPHVAGVFGAYDMLPAEVLDIFERFFVADLVKSARVAHPGRLDVLRYLADAERDVGEAMKQIKRTADLITANTAAFRAVDPSAEIRGIVVTAEPHYMLNSPMFRSRLTDSGHPTAILSLSELEFAVSAALAGDPAGLFRAVTDRGPRGIDVKATARAHAARFGTSIPRNPLLQAAAERGWARIASVGTPLLGEVA